MFNKNVFMKGLEKSRKIIVFIIVFTLIIYLILGSLSTKYVFAGQERQNISARLNNYPRYTELINKLRQAHPNWNFVILYTGLDWNQVIKNETLAWHGRNLVPSNKTGDWICSTCNDKKYDNGTWRCASEAAVSYYMDPRNFLNDDDIFQFEESVFNSSIHNTNGIMKMTNGTFLAGQENAEAMLQACQNVNINPYQVVSRLLQEQGRNGSTMSRGNQGYYNVFNVGATGNSSSQIIANATQYAKNKGWNTLAKSIIGGIDFLKSQYIGKGQNTLYLQKFDIDDSDGSLYYHQYMQNLSAAYTESMNVKNIYRNIGVFNNSISFVIPVYENMPQDKCPVPGTQGIVTQNVKVTGTEVNIREYKSTDSNIIATLGTNTTLLRIEKANVEENGYYWDKVVLSDGRKGYVASKYIEQIEDITNCNENVVANTSVNLRNGPGTNNTSIITTLTKGQIVTRIEKGQYDGLDGYDWNRVKLADGRQGYLASCFLDDIGGDSNNTGNNETIKVITSAGLYVRENPGTDANVLTLLNYGDTANRIEQNVSNANGLIWDKIVTNSGVEGYIARGNSQGSFIEVVDNKSDEYGILGDVDRDGEITPNDYALIKEYIMENVQLNDEEKKYADYDRDGEITPNDYALIKDYIMSL